jgi:hypothetical protein
MATETEEKMGEAEALMHAKALIQHERMEQIQKHGYTPERDDRHTMGQLVKAATFCLTLNGWPLGWSMEHMNHIAMKPYKERIIIAAAFMQAELERILRRGE